MLKHSYHARLSVWHVVLLVIILAVSLPVIAQPFSSPKLSCTQAAPEAGGLRAHYAALPLQQPEQRKDKIQLPGDW